MKNKTLIILLGIATLGIYGCDIAGSNSEPPPELNSESFKSALENYSNVTLFSLDGDSTLVTTDGGNDTTGHDPPPGGGG